MTIRTRLLTLLLCASVCQSMFPQSAAVWSNGAVDAIQQVDSTAVFRLEGKPYLQIWSSGQLVYSDYADSLQFLPVGEDYHDYVDLGLSVKWATCNVGATAPEDYGDYFAWGATEPWYQPGYARSGNPVWKSGKSAGYTWVNTPFQTANTTDYSSTKWTKYLGSTTSSYKDASATDADALKTVLDPADDAAHVNWGGSWRMPTSDDWAELRNTDNCTWTWTTLNGVNGYKVVSKKSGYAGNWIFLPAAGYRYDTYLRDVGSYGYYWSSSLFTSNPDNAFYLFFYSSTVDWYGYGRVDGLSVRPVCPVPVTGISLDRQSVEIMEGNAVTLTATVQLENGVIVNTATWTSSNTGVATVDQTGKITAVSVGTCTVTAAYGSSITTCSVTVKAFEPEYVDLGLSVKWATCNVGATAPEDYGDYFAWGATEPWYQPGYAQESPQSHWKSGKSAGYTWVNTPYQTASTTDFSSTKWTKYLGSTSSSYKDASATDADALKTVLDPADDAAHVNWGGSWRMPTKAEQDELRNTDNCTWTWTTLNGVSGYKVVSKKSGYAGNWIFLPAAGCRYDTSLNNVGSYGYYLSSSLLSSYPRYAYGLYFRSSSVDWFSSDRYCGHSVRPVCPVLATSLSLDRQSVEIMQGNTVTLTATVQFENGAIVNTATWTSSNTSVATVDQTGKITAISAGTCNITASSGSFTATCSVTVKANTHQYVDLGLSVKWATCNVGATAPEGYGDYFAWGATEPWYQPGYAQSENPVWKSGKSAGYTWVNTPYQTANTTLNTSTKWTKYLGSTTSSYKDASATSADALKTVLDPADDAAHANWGGSWRMPTYDDWAELYNTDNCTWTWTTLNGVNGYKVVSKKSGYAGNWIFLPAAGYRDGTFLDDVGSYGRYWSSSLYASYPYVAYYLYFYSSDVVWGNYGRVDGLSVRPVCPVPVTGISLDRQSVEIMEGSTETLTAMVKYENGATAKVEGATWTSSNTSVATVDQTGKITAISAGTCTITASSGSFTATCSMTVKALEPEYVDLGLSVMWATFNVGAEKPEDYGDYFAWGETSRKYDYSWSTYKYCKGSYDSMTKYCNNSSCSYNGFTDSKTVLDLADDAAHANWGGSWRMPTSVDWAELRNTDNCTWTWTTLNGVNGYKVVSRKSGYEGNFIFLPAAGCRGGVGPDGTEGTYLEGVGSNGYYWSSSLNTSSPYNAFSLYFYSSRVGWYDLNRLYGLSVRPVCPVPATSLSLDRQSVEIMQGSTVTLTATVQLENGTTVNTVTWTSSNTGVATVDQTGKITAVSVGTCTVTAAYGSSTATAGTKSATCRITVLPIEVASVTLDRTTASILLGGTTTLTATVLPDNATDKTLLWSSSNPTVATVSNGKITAKAAGTTAITAKSNNGLTATCIITVTEGGVTPGGSEGTGEEEW